MQEKYLKWFLIAIAVLSVGIFYLIWSDLGVGPRGVQKIKLAPIESANAAGKAIYTRLRQEIAQEWVIFVGLAPGDQRHLQTVRGLMTAASEDQRSFTKVFCEKELIDLAEQFPCTELEMNNAANTNTTDIVTELIEIIKQPRNDEVKNTTAPQLFLIPQTFSSHLIPANPIATWEKSFKASFLSITLANMAVRSEQMQFLAPPCLGTERDREGSMDLACTIRRLSRAAQRKPWPDRDLIFQLILEGEKDYLALFSLDRSQPTQ